MRPSLIKAIACSNWPMNVALPIVSQLVQVWVDSRKDGSKTTEIPFINDHRRTFTLIFTLMRQSLLMPLTPNTLRGLVLDDKYIKSWSEQGPDRWFFRALLPTDGTIRYSILLLYGCSVALKKWKTLWFTTVLAVIQIVSCHSWDNLQWLRIWKSIT